MCGRSGALDELTDQVAIISLAPQFGACEVNVMTATIMQDLFGRSPFGALQEHTRKVHECTQLVKPLLEACIAEE